MIKIDKSKITKRKLLFKLNNLVIKKRSILDVGLYNYLLWLNDSLHSIFIGQKLVFSFLIQQNEIID